MKRFDEFDAKILRDLLNDGRKDFAEIARECDVSKNAVWKRYKEMVKSGIIVGATTQINHRFLGQIIAEFLLTSYSDQVSSIKDRVQKISNYLNFPPTSKNNLVVTAFLRDLSEVERVKRIISQNITAAEMKTYIWTGTIINIPENLSFGLPENIPERIYKSQSKPINSLKEHMIDETDKKIMNKLTENGRSPFRKIAKDIGVTTDTVARRYKKLKGNGIMKVVIQISPEKIGYNATLEGRIRLKTQKDIFATVEALSNIPDVFHISETSGDSDLHIWALIRDVKHLLATQEKIFSVPYFGRMETELNYTFMDIYPSPQQHITV